MATTWNTNKYANNGYKLIVIAALGVIMFICNNLFNKEYFFWAGIVVSVIFLWYLTLSIFAVAEKISQ